LGGDTGNLRNLLDRGAFVGNHEDEVKFTVFFVIVIGNDNIIASFCSFVK
jgi:hypothetical protein